MAAALQTEVSSLLRQGVNVSVQALRWKKPPKWRDPTDISWAMPLLERQQRQKKQEGHSQPHMLHMVIPLRTLNGRPYWEKETMKALGLDKKKFSPVVHKNIPEVNHQLEKVKHLVRIVPITFPHGLPSDESDFQHAVLHMDGRLTLQKKIEPVEENVVEKEHERQVWEMDKDTLTKAATKVLEGLHLSEEYFQAKYTYRYNEDGKEHRYHGRPQSEKEKDWF